MRPIPAGILIAALCAAPAPAFERLAHAQPDARSSVPSLPQKPAGEAPGTDHTARERLQNQAEKARQDAFDARLDRTNRRIMASLCRGCGRTFPRPFRPHDGARTGAESIYAPAAGFDPAEARR